MILKLRAATENFIELNPMNHFLLDLGIEPSHLVEVNVKSQVDVDIH